MSFFGFDATLPERRADDDAAAFGDKAGAEDIAVYTWGTEAYDGLGDQLQEQGDDSNDLTFGGGDIGEFRRRVCPDLIDNELICPGLDRDSAGTDFKFAQQTAQYTGNDSRGYQQNQVPTSYGSKSRLKPTKPASDLFASTEADFFGAPKKCKSERTRGPGSTFLTLSLSLQPLAFVKRKLPAGTYLRPRLSTRVDSPPRQTALPMPLPSKLPTQLPLTRRWRKLKLKLGLPPMLARPRG